MAVPDREEERDTLQAQWEQRQSVEPLVAEIQKIRQEKLDLPPRAFTEAELSGPTCVADLRQELAGLQTVAPLKEQIQDLRQQLELGKRVYAKGELDGPRAIPDRTEERDDLLDKLGEKMLIDPLLAEIQALRKYMEMPVRQYSDAEVNGPGAVRERLRERDDLKAMQNLFDEIHDLRKQLQWGRRDFTESELDSFKVYIYVLLLVAYTALLGCRSLTFYAGNEF
jgi:hypothetical protein